MVNLHSDDCEVDQPFLKCAKLFAKDCNYYDLEEVKHVSVPGPKELRIMHINIQSLPSKFDNLKILVDELDQLGKHLDLILICETFLNSSNAHMYNIPGFNFVCHNRTCSAGGGVAIYINNNIDFKERSDLDLNIDGEFESVFVEIKCNNKKTVVGEIYRVPNSNEKKSIERYKNIIEQLDCEKCEVFLGTDQNFDFAKMDTHKNTFELFDNFYSKGFIPSISKPTRIARNTSTIIDNIYVKRKTSFTAISGIIHYYISDHLPIFLFIGNNKTINEKGPLVFNCRSLTEANILNIKNELNKTKWRLISTMTTVQAYDFFITTLENALNKFAPEREIRITRKNVIREPWMTKGILKSIHTRDKLYKKCMQKNKNEELWKDFIDYRNKFNSIKRIAKETHYKQLLYEHKNDIRKTWNVINKLTGRIKKKTSIAETFNIDGQLINNSQRISNGFCKYFTNVGQKLADKIPKSQKSSVEYMSSTPNPNSMYFYPTDQNEIDQIIKSMKNKKSTGYDGISSAFLKKIQPAICKPLSIIINKSLETGEVPSNLKLAKVVPIYKAKDNKLFSNYRPVSLLPCISKILEKVIHRRLYNFLLKNDIFYKSQYGFRPKHSTINAITELCYNITNAFENDECTLAVFLDLSKAFDTIDHTILLRKLAHYGIRGVALEWFKNYLRGRQQYVQINNSRSEIDIITCGVPQGSVLGPLLFIIYTNDMPDNLIHTKAILFADDTTIFQSHDNLTDLFQLMNTDLRTLTDWFKANKLSLNTGKTNCILFKRNKKNLNAQHNKLYLNNEEMGFVTNTKFLGLIIDEHLEWNDHINLCRNRLASGVYTINSLKNILSIGLLRTIYYSMIYPYISYGILLWGSSYKHHLNTIAIQQKRAIRSINRVKYNEHTLPLFTHCRMLKLSEVYQLQLNLFMFSHQRELLPVPLKSIFTINKEIHTHNTRQHQDPNIIRRKTQAMAKSFICRGPETWGSLPKMIKESTTLKSFKNKLKNKYLQDYVDLSK